MGKEKELTKEEALTYRPGVQHSVAMHPHARNSVPTTSEHRGGSRHGNHADESNEKKKEQEHNDGRVRVPMHPSRGPPVMTTPRHSSPFSVGTRFEYEERGGNDKKKEDTGNRVQAAPLPTRAGSTAPTSSSTQSSPRRVSSSTPGSMTYSGGGLGGGGGEKDEKKEMSSSRPNVDFRPTSTSSSLAEGSSSRPSVDIRPTPPALSTERSGNSIPPNPFNRRNRIAADPSMPTPLSSQTSHTYPQEDSEKEKMRLKAEEEGINTRDLRPSVSLSASNTSPALSRPTSSGSRPRPPSSVVPSGEVMRGSSTAANKAREAAQRPPPLTPQTPSANPSLTPLPSRGVSGTPLRPEDVYGTSKEEESTTGHTLPTRTPSASDEKRAAAAAAAAAPTSPSTGPLRPLRNIEHMYPGGRQASRSNSNEGLVSAAGSEATPATTELESNVSYSSTGSRPLHSSSLIDEDEDHNAGGNLNQGTFGPATMRRGPASSARKISKEASNQELVVVQPRNVMVVPESEPLRPRVIDLDVNIDKSTYKGISDHEKAELAKESGILFKDGEVFIDEEAHTRKRRQRRRITFCVVASLLLFGILAGAIGFSVASRSSANKGLAHQLQSNVDTTAPSAEPSMAPSEAPSGAPTSWRESCIVETLTAQSYITDSMAARMRDPSTSQNRAILWLAHEDPAHYNCTDADNLRYRYLFASFYFATDGPSWTYQANFLSGENVCAWWENRKKKKRKDSVGLWCLKNETDGWDVYLNMMENNLTGTIPEELLILEEAYMIALGKNQLTGTIPNIVGDFPAIFEFHVQENHLTGTIADDWGKSGTLTVLNVTGNQLNGTIPNSLGDIPSLTWFYASRNKLSGPIPSSFHDHGAMRRLILSDNALTGNLANAIDTLPRQLEYLWLGSNLVTGTIPAFFGEEFPNMTSLDLRENPGLFGTIPPSLNNWEKLWQITLNGCNLSGEIPFAPHAFPKTNLIQLFNNSFTGTFPHAFLTYGELTILHLSKNELVGTIPTLLGNLTKLREIAVGWNELTGKIPTELGNLWKLERFGCSNNKLTGTLPTELGRLWRMETLSMRNNTFTGTIPSELGNLKYLTEFTADQNALRGALPSSFLNMESLGYLDLSSNALLGNISFMCANEIDILAADCAGDEHVEVICACCSICCDREGECFSNDEQEGGV